MPELPEEAVEAMRGLDTVTAKSACRYFGESRYMALATSLAERAAPAIRKQRDKEIRTHLESLGPHEITCNCSAGGIFEARGHASTCPRFQLKGLLDFVFEEGSDV